MKNKEIDFTKLEFVRIFDPIHIPKELVQQVRDRKYSVEKFYEYQKIVCVSKQPQGVVLNPLNLLFVIINEQKKVVGFLWAVISPLSQELIINTFSMNKEYWLKGAAVKIIESKCKEILKESGLKAIYWITNYPKHSERFGFKRSKGVLMEYKLGEENGRHIIRDGCETSGDSEPVEPSAAGLPKQYAESDARAC